MVAMGGQGAVGAPAGKEGRREGGHRESTGHSRVWGPWGRLERKEEEQQEQEEGR